MNYYNEFDPKAAAWLRELIRCGEIPPGDVDERSIADISPHELTGYTQQHFFAGIGGWSLALKLAGWPANRPVRTGSCPCQPFSVAGKGLGEADKRHLWPVFRDLITFGEPTVTFGEQVASKAGREWLAGVRIDLEGLGYEVGAADLCAAGVGSPQMRQRLFWVANTRHEQTGRGTRPSKEEGRRPFSDITGCGAAGRLGDSNGSRSFSRREAAETDRHGSSIVPNGSAGGLVHSGFPGLEGLTGNGHKRHESGRVDQEPNRSIAEASNPWDRFDLLPCTDGKARRIESGSFPLAHGISGRVGLLRGYGNAIVPQVAAEFIQAYLEVTP